jgi:uncharacterized membrane protein YhaH (DUF805 family)
MSLILLPIAFALVCCLIPGVSLAARGLWNHKNPALGFAQLVLTTASVHLVFFGTPFIVLYGRSINGVLLFLLLFVCVGVVLIAIGLYKKDKFNRTQDPSDAISGAAWLLAGGLIPISWFSLADVIAEHLQIKWLY